MIFTARQLEEMYKAHGRVVLPYRARLSPLAKDWVKHRGVTVGYGDGLLTNPAPAAGCCESGATAKAASPASACSASFLWWCDGPCGAAKAALLGMAKEASLAELPVAMDGQSLVPAIKALAEAIKAGRAAGGIIVVASSAEALVYTNRCPSLRAILGTTMQSVDSGIAAVAANVLVIEHPGKTLQQVRNLLSRFVRGRRELSEDVKQRLADLAACG